MRHWTFSWVFSSLPWPLTSSAFPLSLLLTLWEKIWTMFINSKPLCVAGLPICFLTRWAPHCMAIPNPLLPDISLFPPPSPQAHITQSSATNLGAILAYLFWNEGDEMEKSQKPLAFLSLHQTLSITAPCLIWISKMLITNDEWRALPITGRLAQETCQQPTNESTFFVSCHEALYVKLRS